MIKLISVIGKLNLNFSRLLIILTFLYSNLGQSQPDYDVSLKNIFEINDNIIEFDITIKSVNDTFNLTSYQCSILFNSQIVNGGELSFSYIEGSSQLINLPVFGIGVNNFDGDPKLTFGSMAGLDVIAESNLVMGRFRLVNTVPFAKIDPNITWSFGGLVSTILTGDAFQNITETTNHTSNLTVSSRNGSSDMPIKHQLMQNYPNPFNPSTKIRFALNLESNVKLVVYSVLGEMIQELINNKIAAGNHEYTFNSDGLSSGTYVYRLEVNNEYVDSKKMLLIK